MKRMIILFLIAGVTGVLASGLAQEKRITPESIETLQQFKEQEMETWREMMLREDTRTRTQEDFDALYYELNLQVFLDPNNLEGTVTGRFQSLIDDLETVVLDFDEALTVDEVTGSVSAYQLEGEEFEFTLDRPYNSGEIFEITTTYHGVPRILNDTKAFRFEHHGNVPIVATLSTPFLAHTWWPCKDGPEDKPDSVDINITIPVESYNGYELYASSNGRLTDIVDNGDGTKTFKWHEGYPIPVYYVGIDVSNYRIFTHYYKYSDTDSMEVPYYVFPESYNAAQQTFADVVDMIGFLSDTFCPYPFLDEKYAMSEIGFYGAIENQTNTIMGGVGENFYMTVLHEMSHQWFGDMITCASWHHGWVNEGFATYCEALWVEHLLGFEGYKEYMAGMAYYGNGTVYLEDVSDPFRVFVGIIYNKGAWVLHMLRRVVGDDTFWDIMRTYCQTHAYGYASTEDFQAVCESVYGESLDWYFQQWIYEEGYPDYEYAWDFENTGGAYTVTLRIGQTQTSGPIFEMPMDILIRTQGGDVLETVTVNAELSTFQFEVDAQPVEIIIDPDDWILKRVSPLTSSNIVYQSFAVDDSDGNNNGSVDPGETIFLIVTLVNKGAPVQGVSAVLVTEDPYVILVNGHADYGDLDYFSEVTNGATPFIFTVDPEAASRVVLFTLDITGQGGYENSDEFYVIVGESSVLLIDDDTGELYETYFIPNLGKVVPFDTWETLTQGTPAGTLSHYMAVVWLTGDDAGTTLTGEEQSAIGDYLDDGGNLLLTGQNIGFDLYEQGSAADREFFETYLHAAYVSNTSTEFTLSGIQGDPISDDMGYLTLFDTGAGNQESPDIISPRAEANTVFQYFPSGNVAGIRYSGEYKLVYFAFGFEGLGDFGPFHDQKRSELMRNIMDWFRFVPSKGDVNEDGIINVLDIVRVVNIILAAGDLPTDYELWASDFNEDGLINVLDLVGMVNVILGGG